MLYEEISILLRSNTTLRLLTAANAPLILSFFCTVFKEEVKATIGEKKLIPFLEDHLYRINQTEILYPKPAKAYLSSWTQEGTGFLNKYYGNEDEALYELSPAAEIALKWINELNKSEFVGTESRLKLLFDILKELSVKTKVDTKIRIQELEQQKATIELEIEKARKGDFELFNETQIKERFFNAGETAQRLLSDFRQVEQNFREIDNDFRKKIITTTQVKGKVLDELFLQQDFLWETDQGKSFKAFWDFLMSQSKQQELEALLQDVLSLPYIRGLNEESIPIARIKNNLIEAGDKVNKSTGSLIEQLRKYVEHKIFLENKRIHERITDLLKLISKGDLTHSLNDKFMEIDGSISLNFFMNRPLFKPPQRIRFAQSEQVEGIATNSANPLFDQFFIDMDELKGHVKELLKTRSQVSLKELATHYKIKKGLTEIIGYVEIASKDHRHIVNDQLLEEIVTTNAKTGKLFSIKLPQIIFNR